MFILIYSATIFAYLKCMFLPVAKGVPRLPLLSVSSLGQQLTVSSQDLELKKYIVCKGFELYHGLNQCEIKKPMNQIYKPVGMFEMIRT